MSDRHDTLDRHGHATAAKVATSSPGRAWLAAGAPRRDPLVRPDG